jgi:hypothetical protein
MSKRGIAMKEVILDSLLDSFKVFIFAFAMYFLLSFIENGLVKVLKKENKLNHLFSSLLGVVPQCGLSVVGSDLYLKHHITMGCLISLFIACSDEALPIFLSSGSQAQSIIPILIIKIIIAFFTGFIVDKIIMITKNKKDVIVNNNDDVDEDEVHIGCCHHEIEEKDDTFFKHHIVHPLEHSLKIFIYILVINLLFSILIYKIGEDKLINFLQSNKYLSPVIASIIGVIPNCAASVVISKVYLLGGISMGACISGLIMNAGLGFVYLFKNKDNFKNNLLILGIMFLASIVSGYLICLVIGF